MPPAPHCADPEASTRWAKTSHDSPLLSFQAITAPPEPSGTIVGVDSLYAAIEPKDTPSAHAGSPDELIRWT
jgi:hypothetical protein